jgi:hypothetical protein
MPDANLLAVVVAAVAAFVSGATYYAVFGEQVAEASDAAAAGEQPPPWKLAVIHGGDWLVKLLVVAAIVTVWP